MLTGNQRLELGAETIMNSYGWDRGRATDYVLEYFLVLLLGTLAEELMVTGMNL